MIELPIEAVRRRLLSRGLRRSSRAAGCATAAQRASKAVIVDNNLYPSISAAARVIGVNHGTIVNRIKRGTPGYAWRY